MIRPTWMRVGAAALIGAAVVLVPGGAGAAPDDVTVGVSPPSVLPGEPATVTVAGCDDRPTGGYVSSEYDDAVYEWSFVETSPGTWAQTLTGGSGDLVGFVSCPGSTGENAVVIDVDAPTMFFGPFFGPFGTEDPPTKVIGKDCPPGTTVSIEIQSGDSVISATADLDPQGDWEVDLPASTATEGARVRATCGTVTYDQITYEGAGSITTTTYPTTSTTAPSVVPPVVTPARPAQPRSGSANYTG